MSVLLKRLRRDAVPAAVVAAVTAASVFAADASHGAAAQSRLEAEYIASVAGIPVGRGKWVIEIFDDQYTAAASGATTGIFRFFTGARGTSASHGTLSAG
ncbi:MAG TPA: DUF3108 domain-containing protein, partial [Steroidobacteraceae bacterium]|nr:DUF3108 domain-containing protein [Steroidobacteraceae bacterium]